MKAPPHTLRRLPPLAIVTLEALILLCKRKNSMSTEDEIVQAYARQRRKPKSRGGGEDCTTSTGQNLRLGYLRTPRARSVRERQKEMKLELKPRLGGWGKTTTDVGSRTDVFTHPLARNTVLELGAKEIEGNEESCVLPD